MSGPDVKILGSIGPKSITGNSFDASPDGGTTKLPAVNFPEPVNPSDVATKNYVDTHAAPSPTGTGFSHVTSGAVDSAARAVNLASADVSGVLPTANQAAQSLGGSLGGTTTSGTVKQVDGTGTTDDYGGTGAIANIPATESVFGSGTTHPVVAGNKGATTTDGTTWTTVAVYTPPANSYGDMTVTVLGGDFTGGSATGDHYRADFLYTVSRIGTSAPTLNPSSPPPTNVRSRTTAGSGSPSARVQISSNTVVVQVLGAAAARTWRWSATPQDQRVT